MAVAVAPSNAPPVTDAAKGAKHQIVRAAKTASTTPAASDPVPVAADLKGGTTGAAYTETITAQRGTSPYTFAVTSGALPSGVTLAPSSGVISGTPTVAGTYSFTITVTDVNGSTGAQGFVIVLADPAAGTANYGYVS